MAKHLKVRAELMKPDLQRVKITILEQTHTGAMFGADYSGEFKYSGMTLRSNDLTLGSYGRSSIFNVRSLWENSPNTTHVSLELWPKIKKAIEAYNKRFSEP